MQLRPDKRTAACLVASAALVIGGAQVIGGTSASPETAAATTTNPVSAADGGVHNVAFYYGGTTPLAGGTATFWQAKLGKPALVVSTAGSDTAETVATIHSTGAKAYRYVQFFWGPDNADYEGIDLEEHPEWAFCSEGNTPALGRVTDRGTVKWFFVDANETAVRLQIQATLRQVKAEGWDGVFFDRGQAATQYAEDLAGNAVWSRRSSCTTSPFRPGARFADAYVDMLGLAHGAGLEAMMNNGRSPFDPVTPMRPDPSDAGCRAGTWKRCTFRSDAWAHLDLVLAETASHPKDVGWRRTFAGNQRSERSTTHGRRTVALVTTATLGGEAQQTRFNVFYQWSRLKLFDIPVAVNTGDDRCPGVPGPCNRFGVYPELVDTTFGRPLISRPAAQRCVRGSAVRCVWLRHYAKGVNLLNATPASRRVVVSTKTARCRYVFDVYTRAPLAANSCVERFAIRLKPWSGRPLRYSNVPW